MAELTYHQKKYPHLYVNSPMGGISDLLKSDFEKGGKYGPKITYKGSTPFDPLGVMEPGGMGTGLDLTIPVKTVETEKKVPVAPTGQGGDFSKLTSTSTADDRPTMPATGMTIPSSAYMDEEEDEEGRPKGLFSFLDGVELDGDALIKAGRAIEKGEGIGGAIEAYSDELAANQALEVAKQDKEYDRDRQKKLDDLDRMVKMQDIAYKQSQMTTDENKNAVAAANFEAASEGIDINDKNISEEKLARYYQILDAKMTMILENKKDDNYLTIPGLQEGYILNTLGLGGLGDPLNTGAANQLLQGGGAQSGGTIEYVDGTQGAPLYNTK